MFRYLIRIEYIGTNYHGWQSQVSSNTIQDILQTALKTFFRKDRVILLGASRTDSGVHAFDQVACFDLDTPSLDSLNAQNRFLQAMRALLPADISIKSVASVESDFHPVYKSVSKTYLYQLAVNPFSLSPFIRPFCWQVHPKFDLELFKVAMLSFVGKKNFRSFCAADSSAKTFEREILSIDFELNSDLLKVFITGTGFLKQMIRNIIGTSMEVSLGRIDLLDIDSIFAAKDRSKAGPTAPARGLILYKIYYK